jgi:hypothetical protein
MPLTDGAMGRPEQVARLVLFLASDASDLITGTEVWIDGAESLLRAEADDPSTAGPTITTEETPICPRSRTRPPLTTVPARLARGDPPAGGEQDRPPPPGSTSARPSAGARRSSAACWSPAGLTRGSFAGLGLAVLGGALAYRGFTGHCQAYAALNIDTSGKHRADADDVHKGRLVKHTATINRPAEEIYDSSWSRPIT